MDTTTLMLATLIVLLFSRGTSQYCYYNKDSDVGHIECSTRAITTAEEKLNPNDIISPESVEGIFFPDGNNLPEIKVGLFASFVKLKSIHIGNSGVVKIQPGAFDGLQLLSLQLNYNNIKSVEKGIFNSLNTTTMLELAGNQLESLDADIFLGMSSLAWISLSGNRLKHIHKDAFNGLGSLQLLHMISNQLEVLELGTFDSLTSLTFLDLTANLLRYIKFGLFKNLRNLDKLVLEDNRLEELPDYVFGNLTAVTNIDLSRNRIKELQENLFYGIENLQTLRFASNNITQFDSKKLLVHVPKLQEVDLNYNPWPCEELKRIRAHFESKKVFVPVIIPVTDKSNVEGIACNE